MSGAALAAFSPLHYLPAWIPAAVALALAWVAFRGGGLGAWRDTAEGWQARAGELEQAAAIAVERADRAEQEAKKLAALVGALEQRTNLEPIAAAVVEQFAAHELRAQQRHEATLLVFERIADRLGPDDWNGHPKSAAA